MLSYLSVFTSTIISPAAAAVSGGFINGSFEAGDFSGWITQDVPNPNDPLLVRSAGNSLNVSSTFGDYLTGATDGQFSASHSFSGDSNLSPSTIRIAQDILIDQPILRFDHRANWILAFSMIGKDFSVTIESTGGGVLLDQYLIFSALPHSIQLDGQFEAESVDLTSFLGQSVRVSFDWMISDTYPHPAVAELDNVRLTPVPEPASVVLQGCAIVATMMAGRFVRRRKVDDGCDSTGHY